MRQARGRCALIAHAHDALGAVPATLAEEIARITSLAQGIWAEARAKNDVAHFLPMLTRVVDLRREEGQAMAAAGVGGGDAYDALIDDYEPGASGASLGAMFDRDAPASGGAARGGAGRAAAHGAAAAAFPPTGSCAGAPRRQRLRL